MKTKYLVVAILLMLVGIINTKALAVGDCKVLASYKLYSSLDEEKFICKGVEFGKSNESIYYSGTDSTIKINAIDIYYFSASDQYDITLDITGKNTISMLRLTNNEFKVTGKGELKFKQNSYVKKVAKGEPIYYYVYKDKTVLAEDEKSYEGTTLEFEENYETLKEINKLPEEYNIEDYVLTQVIDFTKMTSVIVTESWISSHIKTDLSTSISNGYGVIKYVEPKKEEVKETVKQEITTLESDKVILIAEEKVNKKYKLNVDDLKEEEIAQKVSDSIDKLLVGLYDVNVYNGKKIVSMKNGKYTIKIKLENDINEYENYQIIYVNDDGEIVEYIDGKIEDGYIVFTTSHLSQYGVIASPIIEEVAIEMPVKKKSINVGYILKIAILVTFTVVSLGLIGFITFKSKILSKKKRTRKRA